MSWAEVFKINNNMKKPLNEQMRDMKFQPIRIITATGTFKPEKTGLYKVICVGAGGNGEKYGSSGANVHYIASGGGGGVAIKTLRLLSTTSYNITVGTTASFTHGSGSLTAVAGSDGDAAGEKPGKGGTASGGDLNYTGTDGSYLYVNSSKNHQICPTPGSVGVFISDLSRKVESTWVTLVNANGACQIRYGDSILGYGGGGSGVGDYYSTSAVSQVLAGLPAAVIIAPIEMEE